MNNKIDLSVIRENGEVVGTKKMNINGIKKNMEVFVYHLIIYTIMIKMIELLLI